MNNDVILQNKKLTYEDKILKYLEYRKGEWIYAYEFCNKTTPFGWIGNSGDRIARKMSQEGLIEREGREEGQFYAKYRLKQLNQTLF